MSDSCSGGMLPPFCVLPCPCDPANSDGCLRSGFCQCRAPYCGPRCSDTGCVSGGGDDLWKIIVSVVVGAVVLVLLIVAFIFYRRRKDAETQARTMEDAAAKHILKGSHSNLRFPFDKDDSDYLREVKVEQSPRSVPSTVPPVEVVEEGDEEYIPDDQHPQSPPPPVPVMTSTNGSGQPRASSSPRAYKPSQVAPPEQLPLIRHVPAAHLTTTGGSNRSSSSSSSEARVITVSKPVNVAAVQSYSIPTPAKFPISRPPTEYAQATPIHIAEPEDEAATSSSSSGSSRGRGPRNNGAYSVVKKAPPNQGGHLNQSSH